MGRPLSQTLFTSLYIDKLLDPKNAGNLSFGSSKFGPQSDTSIVHRVLLAYCLATVKTCSHVNNRVKAEHLYEV